MLNLKKVHDYPVSLIKVCKHNNYLKSIPEHINKSSPAAKIYSLVSNDELEFLETSGNNVFITSKNLRKILIQNLTEKQETVNFCSVIIVNDIQTDTVEKLIVINLWKEIYKISKIRPFLIITTLSDITPEFPFSLSMDQTQDITGKKEFDVEYHDSNFTPQSGKIGEVLYNIIIEKNEKTAIEGSKVWLVFYCKDNNLEKRVYESLKNTVNIFTSDTIKNINFAIDSQKRTIIFVKDNFFPSTFSTKIDMIIDSMIFKINNNLTYSSKQNSEIRASYQEKGKVFRLCTESYYQESPRINIREYDKDLLEKNYLVFIYYEINVKSIFNNIQSLEKIDISMKDLENRGAVTNNKITPLGKMIIYLPLKTANCDLIYLWIYHKKPIFPVIVTTVFSELTSPFYIKKTNFMKSPLHSYLKTFNDILKEIDNLDSIDYTEMSKKYNVNSKILKDVVEKIKSIITVLKKNYNFTIGNYNTDNLISKLIPYYEICHYSKIHTIVDRKNFLYRCSDIISKINFYKHYYDKKKIPKKIVCFERNRVNEEVHSIQKGKNYIDYFLEI